MLTLKDCLDYSDLTEDTVNVLALHERLPFASAAQMACALAQSDEGTEVLRCLLKNALCQAESCGHAALLEQTRQGYVQFMKRFPACSDRSDCSD